MPDPVERQALPDRSARDALMSHVAAVGSSLCAYLPGHGNPEKWPTSHCDCKYGLSGRGEETGCPEMRTLYRRLHMDAGFAPFLGLALPADDTHLAPEEGTNG